MGENKTSRLDAPGFYFLVLLRIKHTFPPQVLHLPFAKLILRLPVTVLCTNFSIVPFFCALHVIHLNDATSPILCPLLDAGFGVVEVVRRWTVGALFLCMDFLCIDVDLLGATLER